MQILCARRALIIMSTAARRLFRRQLPTVSYLKSKASFCVATAISQDNFRSTRTLRRRIIKHATINQKLKTCSLTNEHTFTLLESMNKKAVLYLEILVQVYYAFKRSSIIDNIWEEGAIIYYYHFQNYEPRPRNPLLTSKVVLVYTGSRAVN